MVDNNFQCDRCRGLARPIEGRPCDSITLGGHALEVVDTFCYLGDTVSTGGGCKHGTIARTQSAWGKFRELLPLLTNRILPSKPTERFSMFVCVLSCCMVVSVGQ